MHLLWHLVPERSNQWRLKHGKISMRNLNQFRDGMIVGEQMLWVWVATSVFSTRSRLMVMIIWCEWTAIASVALMICHMTTFLSMKWLITSCFDSLITIAVGRRTLFVLIIFSITVQRMLIWPASNSRAVAFRMILYMMTIAMMELLIVFSLIFSAPLVLTMVCVWGYEEDAAAANLSA